MTHLLDRVSQSAPAAHDFLMDVLAVGFVQVACDGRILRANSMARAILDRRDGILVRHGCLTATRSADASKLRTLFKAACHRPSRPSALSIERDTAVQPLILLCLPREEPERGALILMRDTAADVAPPAEWLRSWFGLTQSEARLATLLAAGHSVEAAAERLGVSIATTRTHVRRLFMKTGTSRQPELVARIASIPWGAILPQDLQTAS